MKFDQLKKHRIVSRIPASETLLVHCNRAPRDSLSTCRDSSHDNFKNFCLSGHACQMVPLNEPRETRELTTLSVDVTTHTHGSFTVRRCEAQRGHRGFLRFVFVFEGGGAFYLNVEQTSLYATYRALFEYKHSVSGHVSEC